MPTIAPRLSALTADGNLDLEDLLFAIQAARADGKLTPDELAELSAAVRPYTADLEPAAAALVADLVAGKARLTPRRVLLAVVPNGANADLYQPRAEVVQLQEALATLGLPCGTDGVYGQGTAGQVKALQTSAGLPATGQVDTATLLLLNERLLAKGAPMLDLSPRARIRPDFVIAMRGGTNTGENKAIQAALARLAGPLALPELAIGADGGFGAQTETAVKAFQKRAYLPETGIVDRTTLGALDDALAAFGQPKSGVDPSRVVSTAGAVELHFYPGPTELKLYVLRNGQEVARYGMVGGQDRTVDDPRNPTVDYGPSPSGSYQIVRVSPHASNAWSYSYVPYGAPLRDKGGEIEFRDVDGAWKLATGPASVFAGRNPPPLPRSSYIDGSTGKPYAFWQLNDFGHLRGQLKSLRTGQLQGHMIHSSPKNEETANYFAETRSLVNADQALSRLDYSHGCEHIHPRDMDDLVSRGWLGPGTTFVVHGYDERRPT